MNPLLLLTLLLGLGPDPEESTGNAGPEANPAG